MLEEVRNYFLFPAAPPFRLTRTFRTNLSHQMMLTSRRLQLLFLKDLLFARSVYVCSLVAIRVPSSCQDTIAPRRLTSLAYAAFFSIINLLHFCNPSQDASRTWRLTLMHLPIWTTIVPFPVYRMDPFLA